MVCVYMSAYVLNCVIQIIDTPDEEKELQPSPSTAGQKNKSKQGTDDETSDYIPTPLRLNQRRRRIANIPISPAQENAKRKQHDRAVKNKNRNQQSPSKLKIKFGRYDSLYLFWRDFEEKHDWVVDDIPDIVWAAWIPMGFFGHLTKSDGKKQAEVKVRLEHHKDDELTITIYEVCFNMH